MPHQLLLLGGEVLQDRLQAGHGSVRFAVMAEAQQHIALGFLNLKDRADRLAALGDDRINAPGPLDQAADGAVHDAVPEQKGAVLRGVLPGDPPDLLGFGVGEVQAADHVIDRGAGWIEEQEHGVASVRGDTGPVDPALP